MDCSPSNSAPSFPWPQRSTQSAYSGLWASNSRSAASAGALQDQFPGPQPREPRTGPAKERVRSAIRRVFPRSGQKELVVVRRWGGGFQPNPSRRSQQSVCMDQEADLCGPAPQLISTARHGTGTAGHNGTQPLWVVKVHPPASFLPVVQAPLGSPYQHPPHLSSRQGREEGLLLRQHGGCS